MRRRNTPRRRVRPVDPGPEPTLADLLGAFVDRGTIGLIALMATPALITGEITVSQFERLCLDVRERLRRVPDRA